MHPFFDYGWFSLSHALATLLRTTRYSNVDMSRSDDDFICKRRTPLAPLLVYLVGILYRLLDTGVRVLPQREWERRERDMYQILYGTAPRIEEDGTLGLPRLPGQTLGHLLENGNLHDASRARVVELALVSLRRLHENRLTHADAMIENVLVDFSTGAANWFDFENLHEDTRDFEWRCADDVRAFIASCMLRTLPQHREQLMVTIVTHYANERILQCTRSFFENPARRALPFHLGQAALSRETCAYIAQLMGASSRPR